MAEEESKLGVALREVRTARKIVETPRRALGVTVTGPSEALSRLNPRARGLVELYRELSLEMLQSINGNPEAQRSFVGELERRVNSLPSDLEVVLLTLAFPEKGFTPGLAYAEYLADLAAAPFVDAAMVPGVLPKDLDVYVAYVQGFLEAFESMNQTPLLGYIPNLAYRDIRKVVDLYLKRDVKDFAFEFNGHHAGNLYPNVHAVKRLLRGEVGDDFYLHGLNVGPGIFRRSQPSSPSKDFLALLAGVDSFGSKHVRKRMPTRVWRRLASDRAGGRRLFSRQDYGYYQPELYRETFGGAEEEGVIPAIPVCDNPLPQAVRLFNAERQALETESLRQRLAQGSLFDYVLGKPHLRQDVAEVAREWGQTTLQV